MQNEDLTLRIGEKGAEEAAKKVDNLRQKLSGTGKDTQALSDTLGKASVALAAVGVGLTAYSKHATNAAVDYVKSAQSIARITGDSVEQTSRLQYVFQRSGIAADQAAQVFGIFSRQIVATNDAMKEGAAKQAEYNNKVEAAKLKIKALTDEQTKNGDASGEIRNKIDALNISIAGYQKQLTDSLTPLQKLNVSTKNADGASRSFNDILLDVADKFRSMPNGAEKTATALDLFGRSGKSLIPVLNKGSEGIQELEKQADKLGLTITSKNLDAVAKYVAAQKKLKDDQQALTIAIGNEALPMWQKLADAQVRLAESFQNLPAPLKTAAASVLAFGGPVTTAASGVAAFGSSITDISGKNFPDMLKNVPLLGKALEGFGGGLKAVGTLLLGWPGIILGAVVAGGLLLNHFGLLKPILEDIKGAFESVGGAIKNGLEKAYNDLVAAYNVVKPSLDSFRHFVADLIKPAIDSLKTSFDSIKATISGQLAPAFDTIRAALAPLQPMFNMIGEALKIIGVIILGVLLAPIALLVAGFIGITVAAAYVLATIVKIWSDLFNITASIFNSIVQNIGGAWNWIKGIFGAGVDWIQGVWNRIADFPGQVARWLGGVAGAVGGALSSVRDTISGWIDKFYNSGKALIDTFANGIKDAFGNVKNNVNSGLSSVRKLLPFSDAKEGPLSTLTLSGRRFSETFAHGIDQGAGSIMSAATNALTGLTDGSLKANIVQPTVTAVPSQVTQSADTGSGLSQASNDSARPIASVSVELNVATMIGGDDASMRKLAVQMAQMVQDALKGQGVNNVSQLRGTA